MRRTITVATVSMIAALGLGALPHGTALAAPQPGAACAEWRAGWNNTKAAANALQLYANQPDATWEDAARFARVASDTADSQAGVSSKAAAAIGDDDVVFKQALQTYSDRLKSYARLVRQDSSDRAKVRNWSRTNSAMASLRTSQAEVETVCKAR